MAVPARGLMGSSNCVAEGSAREFSCCGTCMTWLAQRVRAVILPSVMTVSPFFSLMRFRVQ